MTDCLGTLRRVSLTAAFPPRADLSEEETQGRRAGGLESSGARTGNSCQKVEALEHLKRGRFCLVWQGGNGRGQSSVISDQ